MVSIFEPLFTRFREYRFCAYCNAPMVARCSVHGTAICGDPDCYSLHRLGVNGRLRAGSLTRPERCLFMRPTTPREHVRNTVIAFAVGLALLAVIIL